MKKYSHSYNYGKRINPVSIGISLVIAFIWCISGDYDDTYVADKPEVSVFMTATVVENPENESIETKIRKYFPRSSKTMLAVAYAESGLNHDAQNWNCYYSHGVATTTPIKGGSRSCEKKDRALAWSMDCGVLMKNYIGVKQCPKVDVDEHLQEMAELSKARGFQPWVAYSNGSYKKYLSQK